MIDINQIKSAIRKAMEERKAKTWLDFYGVPYEDMYEYLGDRYATITWAEYDHLLQCKEELIQLHEAQINSLRTRIASEAIEGAISQQLTNTGQDAMSPLVVGGAKF